MLIVLSGRTASGKSTLAKALAAELKTPCASFGDFVRTKAIQSGLDSSDRLTLQNLGQTLVESDANQFVQEFLKSLQYDPAIYFVVDGLRHLKILDALQNAITAPDRMTLVFVDVPDGERTARLRARGQSEEQILAIEQHKSERDVLVGLREQASIRVDGVQEIGVLVGDIKKILGL